MNCKHPLLISLLAVAAAAPNLEAGLAVREWFFGNWSCTIDGRPARMNWRVVDNPETQCSGGICTTTSGVTIAGRFSDNGSAWVPLRKMGSTATTLSIRYLGREQDNWFLRRNPSTGRAEGYTTWRGNRYPLTCRQ